MASLWEQKGTRVAGFVLLAIIGWFALTVSGLQWQSPAPYAWTACLYFLCWLPTFLFIGGHPIRIPLMPMWGLGYFMMFGIPMFSEGGQFGLQMIHEETLVAMLRLVVCGAAVCILAFYSPLTQWVDELIPKIRSSWEPRRAPLFGVALCLIGLLLQYYLLTHRIALLLAQFLGILGQLSVIGAVVLFLLQLRGLLRLRLKFFLWGFMLPVKTLLALGSGALWQAILVLSPLLFCYSAERQRIPWKAMLLAGLLFIPLHAAKGEYRSYAWEGGERFGTVPVGTAPYQRGLFYLKLVGRRITEGGIETYTVAMEDTHARISFLGVFAQVVELTPSVIPYWRGESYQSFFWSLVPRALFPNKPENTIGQAFGHRYGFLDEEDRETSFNLPHQVIEMYINFGSAGVVVGMGVVGFLYRLIGTTLGYARLGERGLVIGCALLASLLNLDSSFSLTFGGVVYYVLIMYLAFRFLPEPKSQPSPHRSELDS